ncbi:type II/IV secretion system protein [Pelagibacterales bacterium SAG-MED28]|nr:type II/IV secretion system protein [Pelagibacterales bacterium SAG-MED28]|tara:strand:+ start:683 stop:2395 length:1713 start_codon:yes stop_codon:yes gene_type:complete
MFKSKLDNTSEQSIISMLREHDALDEDQVTKIRNTSSEIGKTKLETAFELNLTDEDKILKILSNTYSLEVANLKKAVVTDNVKNAFDKKFIEQNLIAPFEVGSDFLKIAISDGSKLSMIKTFETMTNKAIEVHAAKISDIEDFISRIKGQSTNADTNKGTKNAKLERKKTKDKVVEIGDDVIEFGNKVISNAVELGASDIHIECFRDSAQIRYRIDGILRIMDNYSKYLFKEYDAIITRVKIMSALDIAERRKPQDGAAAFKNDTKEVDLRISILPTKNKERIVMRILNKEAGDKKLSELGFEAKDLTKLEKAITSPQGMVLVTGPTGSGKTTTLYSVLKHINQPGMNILTAEDPVEYELDGIGQVQVKEQIGYTFEEALRSFLRQDPEVILVGEIRDKATVDIALKASLTGHLVFSTLHTNDAPSSITRLLNMGTPNYLISAALTLVMAQRLARKNCAECKIVDESINPKILTDIGFNPEESLRAKIHKGKGCDKCGNTGYKGRMGIYEILVVDKDIKNGILKNLTQLELTQIAKKNGFKTMQEMGHDLLLSGDLSFKEYDRVMQSDIG